MYDEMIINKDLNICFFSGKIMSEPEFKFFYNSKKYISKALFYLETEKGLRSSKKIQNTLIKFIAYNEMADYIYKNCNINDNVIIRGYLQKDEIVICKILFLK